MLPKQRSSTGLPFPLGGIECVRACCQHPAGGNRSNWVSTGSAVLIVAVCAQSPGFLGVLVCFPIASINTMTKKPQEKKETHLTASTPS